MTTDSILRSFNASSRFPTGQYVSEGPDIKTVNSSMPENCVELPDDFIPWNNTDNIVSAETEQLIDRVKSVYVLWAMGVIGVPCNIINMAVFSKQGLKERINLCLAALSFADFVYMAQNIVLFGERLNPRNTDERFGPVFTYMINQKILGLFGFLWASQFMSAVIASERCFCILFPLRSKTLLTTTTMAVIIVVAFVLIVGGLFVVSMKFYVVCAYERSVGQTTRFLSTSEFYRQNSSHIEWLIFFMYGLVPGIFLVIVIVTTIATARELKRVVHWRSEAVSMAANPTTSSGVTASAREIKRTRMLIATSCLFVVCFLPYFVFRVTCFFVKELNAGRRYHNLYYVMLSILDIASFVNSSCNAFVYYSMGSRYRQHFWELMCSCSCCCRKLIVKYRSSTGHIILTETATIKQTLR